MVILDKFKESRDKAFDYIDHSLLITKLSWYGVTTKSFNLFFFLFKNYDAEC